jgi:BlaI family transcriptional regulator, penicillinase repressor
MTARNTSIYPMTALQQAILDFVWERGPVSADDIRQALQPKYLLKDPTVRTMLRRLEARGYIAHRTEGKVFMYRAKVHSRSVAAKVVRNIIKRFCAGSAEQFLMGLVDEKVLSMAELQRLADKIGKQK